LSQHNERASTQALGHTANPDLARWLAAGALALVTVLFLLIVLQ
jgi:hypothetical protein